MIRLPLLTLALAATALTIASLPGAAEGLQFDRNALAQGQLWRLFTGHLTHFDSDHLRWDVLALLLIGTLAERDGRCSTALTLGIAALAIGLAVLWFQPQFTTYRGLSGLDSALFGLVVARHLVAGWRERHRFSVAVGALAALGFMLKTLYELSTGDTAFAQGTGYAPVPLAHLVGFVVGGAVAVVPVEASGPGYRGSMLRAPE